MVFMERGLLRPSQKPSLTTSDIPPTATTVTERGLPMPSLKLRPIPTTWPIQLTVTDMVFTERGLPMHSQKLRPIPTTWPIQRMVTDMVFMERGLLRPTLRPSLTTMDTPPTATTAMERDLPMLSLKLRLIPTI